MSHDRGCFCGREKWEYRECPKRRGITSDCAKEHIIAMWDNAARPPKKPETAASPNPRALIFWEYEAT